MALHEMDCVQHNAVYMETCCWHVLPSDTVLPWPVKVSYVGQHGRVRRNFPHNHKRTSLARQKYRAMLPIYVKELGRRVVRLGLLCRIFPPCFDQWNTIQAALRTRRLVSVPLIVSVREFSFYDLFHFRLKQSHIVENCQGRRSVPPSHILMRCSQFLVVVVLPSE